jgi:hypothetical protein
VALGGNVLGSEEDTPVRILAFSDVSRWNGYERLVDRYSPHVVALAGDLTSDGSADFWNAALEAVPEYKKQIEALERERMQCLLRENGIRLKGKLQEGREQRLPNSLSASVVRLGQAHPGAQEGSVRILRPGPEARKIEDRLREVSELARRQPAYQAARKKMHVDKFYRFLKYAGKRACVLVIKGDHDDDFPGDYEPDRINRIPGCHEISGGAFETNGIVFLGVSYQETAYRRTPHALLAKFPQRGAIVLSHARQRNVRLLAELRPGLIIRGHSGFGKYLLEGIPAVFTAGAHAVIDIPEAGTPRICQPASDKATTIDGHPQDYAWLQPYKPPG